MILSTQHMNRLRLVLERQPRVRRAILVESGEKPTVAFEYDERPATVEEAGRGMRELVAAVAPALGRAAHEVGFSAGGPEEVGPMTARGTVVYEREPSP